MDAPERQITILRQDLHGVIQWSNTMKEFVYKYKKYIFASILFLIAVLAAAIIICFEKKPPREIKAAGVTFIIPEFLPKYELEGDDKTGNLKFGSIEKRCACKEQFLEISWSDKEIYPEQILSSVKSKKTSGKSYVSAGGKKFTVADFLITTVKPCGSEVEEQFKIIILFDAKRKRYFAASGVTDQIMTEKALTDILKKVKYSFLFPMPGGANG
jgi:hypothetical protein